MKTLIFDLDGTLVRLQPSLVCIVDKTLLDGLRTQYNLALISGGTKEEVFTALNTTGLREYFDDGNIVTFDDTHQEKATGEPFREIKRRLDGDMVMIGDSDGDESGARAAGMLCVRVPLCRTMEEQKMALVAAIDLAVKQLA